MSTTILEFGHGRVSNASIETYFRTIKSSVLEHNTNNRPSDFLLKNYNHILSRFKGDYFGVSQSSHGRKKTRGKVNDLNMKDEWRRRGRSNRKTNGRGYHFSEKVIETVACKLS
jgi:hypothetical protein